MRTNYFKSVLTFVTLALAAASASALPFVSYNGDTFSVDAAPAGGLPNGLVTSVAGATTVDFNSMSTGLIASTTAGDAMVNYTGGGIFNNSILNVTAQLPLNTSQFYSTGPSPSNLQSTPGVITFSDAAGVSYFGFNFGSPDLYNSVIFHSRSNSFTLTGAQMAALVPTYADGDQSKGYYLNAYAAADDAFISIEFVSSVNAFETDNHAYITAVPEPGELALIGLGLGLLAFVTRRRKSV